MKICDRCKKEVDALTQIPGARINGNQNAIQKVEVCDPCHDDYLILFKYLESGLFDVQRETMYQARLEWLANPNAYTKRFPVEPAEVGHSFIERVKEKFLQLCREHVQRLNKESEERMAKWKGKE